MSNKISQFLSRSIIALAVIAVVAANARPSHFADNAQASPDQDSNLIENGPKPWQLELLLAAQRLSELNSNQNQIVGNGNDYGWDRGLRNPELVKRQSRYRQCYFNPISCFRK